MFIAISAVFILCILFASQITAYTNPPIRMPPENLCINPINPANIRLNNGYYNVSMTLCSTGATTSLQKFFVYPMATSDISITNKTIPDMLVYFNGTAENPNQLNYNLKSDDNLQVNCLIPDKEYAPNSIMSTTIYTSQAIYCTGFSLNWLA